MGALLKTRRIDMAKYKKKPATVEAVQWGSQDSYDFIRSQIGNSNVSSVDIIRTYTGTTVATINITVKKSPVPGFLKNILSDHYKTISMKVEYNDWIIKTTDGEIYSMTDESFKKNYEHEGYDG
jgi:hypothetical protein